MADQSAYVNTGKCRRRGLAGGDAALIDSARMPGAKMIRSAGGAEVVATVVIDRAAIK